MSVNRFFILLSGRMLVATTGRPFKAMGVCSFLPSLLLSILLFHIYVTGANDTPWQGRLHFLQLDATCPFLTSKKQDFHQVICFLQIPVRIQTGCGTGGLRSRYMRSFPLCSVTSSILSSFNQYR